MRTTVELTAGHGALQLRYLDPEGTPLDPTPGAIASLRFYRDDLLMNTDGTPVGWRPTFIRSADADVAAWLFGGPRHHKESSR